MWGAALTMSQTSQGVVLDTPRWWQESLMSGLSMKEKPQPELPWGLQELLSLRHALFLGCLESEAGAPDTEESCGL